MFNATWRLEKKSTDGKIFFFLGSPTAGDNWLPKEVGQWRTRVQCQRFDTLFASLQMKLFEENSFEMKTSKVQQRDWNGFCYGNCADTYPFMFNIRGYVLTVRSAPSLALLLEYQWGRNGCKHSHLPATLEIILRYSLIMAVANFQRCSGRKEGRLGQPGRASDC